MPQSAGPYHIARIWCKMLPTDVSSKSPKPVGSICLNILPKHRSDRFTQFHWLMTCQIKARVLGWNSTLSAISITLSWYFIPVFHCSFQIPCPLSFYWAFCPGIFLTHLSEENDPILKVGSNTKTFTMPDLPNFCIPEALELKSYYNVMLCIIVISYLPPSPSPVPLDWTQCGRQVLSKCHCIPKTLSTILFILQMFVTVSLRGHQYCIWLWD